MAKTYTSPAVKRKYNMAHYDRIEFSVPKGRKEELKQIAESRGMSLSAFIIDCIEKGIGN